MPMPKSIRAPSSRGPGPPLYFTTEAQRTRRKTRFNAKDAMDTRWAQRRSEPNRALCVSFASFALPKDSGFAGDDLRLDAGRRQQLAEPPVEAPPPAVIFEWAQQPARNDAETAHPLDPQRGLLPQLAQERGERERLLMRRIVGPQRVGKQWHQVFAGEVQGRWEDRHADHQGSAGAQHPHQRRDRGIERGEVLEHLLADDDVVMLGRDLGIAAGQIAYEVVAVEVLPIQRRIADIGGRDGDVVEMWLGVEVTQQRAPTTADIEQRQGLTAPCGSARPFAD